MRLRPYVLANLYRITLFGMTFVANPSYFKQFAQLAAMDRLVAPMLANLDCLIVQ